MQIIDCLLGLEEATNCLWDLQALHSLPHLAKTIGCLQDLSDHRLSARLIRNLQTTGNFADKCWKIFADTLEKWEGLAHSIPSDIGSTGCINNFLYYIAIISANRLMNHHYYLTSTKNNSLNVLWKSSFIYISITYLYIATSRFREHLSKKTGKETCEFRILTL
jgi:hypothetical protein